MQQGYSIIWRKGPVTNTNFSMSGHFHEIMQILHVLDFSNKKT